MVAGEKNEPTRQPIELIVPAYLKQGWVEQGYVVDNGSPQIGWNMSKKLVNAPPAGWTYTSGKQDLMKPEEVKSTIDAEGDGQKVARHLVD